MEFSVGAVLKSGCVLHSCSNSVCSTDVLIFALEGVVINARAPP